MTKNKAIETIENSFPSIWSKDDVLSLLNQIDESIADFDKDELIKKIKSAVKESIEQMSDEDIVDEDTFEFSITRGNEIVVDSFSVKTSRIVENVVESVEEAINEYIEESAD